MTAFKIILLIALTQGTVYFWIEYTQARNTQYRWLEWALYILNIVGLWGGIAYWLRQYLAALTAALLTVGTVLVRIYVLPPNLSFRFIDYSVTKTLLDFTTCLIPTLVFGWIVFRDKRAWVAMLLGALLTGVTFIDG
ncbi:hypothetical protein BKI52_29175 [marine bacterium AO1-C]|nr:hypothetical protein BKI52_29175 [marine bacterium AO1-C]